MNFLENLHAIVISLSLAILLPITVYWGVNSIYTYPNYKDFKPQQNQNLMNDKTQNMFTDLQTKQWEEAKKPFNNAMFYSSIIIGILLIIISSYTTINTLSIGLIIGGILNILMGLFFNPKIALVNFVTVLFVLITIIYMVIKTNKTK